MVITKQDGIKVVEKFGLPLKGKKERIAILSYNGQRVLSTAVPKGRGDMICTDKFRKQLKLNDEQLREAVKCPFGREEWYLHLRELKLIV